MTHRRHDSPPARRHAPAACGAHTHRLDRATHSTLNPLLARADPRGLLHRVDTQRIIYRRLMQRLRSPKLHNPPFADVVH